MTTESHWNRIEALIYKLESAAGVCEVEGFDDEADANRKAIEAIRVLEYIALNGDNPQKWCIEQAKKWLESL